MHFIWERGAKRYYIIRLKLKLSKCLLVPEGREKGISFGGYLRQQKEGICSFLGGRRLNAQEGGTGSLYFDTTNFFMPQSLFKSVLFPLNGGLDSFPVLSKIVHIGLRERDTEWH